MLANILEVTEQMNSDMFDRVGKGQYNVAEFSELVLNQAKESFNYNGYSTFEKGDVLTVKKVN